MHNLHIPITSPDSTRCQRSILGTLRPYYDRERPLILQEADNHEQPKDSRLIVFSLNQKALNALLEHRLLRFVFPSLCM